MAMIDIRATVTCSLGAELISGSVSDDYIQGSGLVKTKGSCELVGIHTPAVGTAVTFSYVSGGVTKTLPRKLRVLSSFADPFRNTTKVELGCLLTYKGNVTPVPKVDGEAAVTSGRRQQCLNGYIDYPADAQVPYPISAAGVMNQCLQKLRITASRNPLTNQFNRETFDLSSGYVDVLSGLLESEGFFGYMDESDVLQVRDLTKEGGKGPHVDGRSVIDLGAIGVGDLPGEAVVVRYDSLVLDGDLDLTDLDGGKRKNWEEDEVVGSPQQLEVRYTDSNGAAQAAVVSFIPYSKTLTEYGEDESWGETTCVIASSFGEGADLSDSVIKRTTKERCVLGAVANNYCSELLSNGFSVALSQEGEIKTEEEYEYDNKGSVVRRTRRVYEPFFKWMGGIDITYVYQGDVQAHAVPAWNDPVLVEEVVETYETIYAHKPVFLALKAGETYEPAVEAQKTTTVTYQNWALTQQGQQGAAQIKESSPFASVTDASAWLQATSKVMVLVDMQVQTDRTRDVAGQFRAPKALRIGQQSSQSTKNEAQLIYALGSASSERFAAFTMPYQSDDYYTSSGVVVRSNAGSKALRYGRIQNRLLLGNRNGANLQLPPSKMPKHPFDPLYVSNGSLMVQYRANAINWAFSKDGIVSSVDALYWGVAGGTGTAWVPVAPGVTTFPPLPSVVGDEVDVDGVVPPWGETVPTTGVTHTKATIQAFTYAVGSLGTTDLGVAVTRTTMQYIARLAADGRTFNVSGEDANIKRIRGIAGEVGAFNLTGMAADRLGFYVLKAESTSFDVSGKLAKMLYQRAPMPLGAGIFNVSGMDAGSFSGKGMELAGATFNVNGQDASMKATRVLTGAPAVFTVSGRPATLGQPDPYFSNVVLLLHMNGANGSASFVDSSSSAKAVTAHGGAVISTTQSKFGGSSGAFDGANAYLMADDSQDWYFGVGDFTIEAFIRLTAQATTATIASQRGTDTSSHAWSFAASTASGGQLQFRYTANGSTVTARSPAWVPALGTWYHVCACRAAGNLRLFVDGVMINSGANGVDIFNSTKPLMIGAGNNSSTATVPNNYLNGYIQDLRITKGIGRYTGNFTVPSQPFPDF